MSPTATTEILTLSRLIKAPRPRVFAAWTTPELAQWLCVGPRQVLTAKVDLRIGGEYHIKIRSEEHGEMEFRGVYRQIDAPERVVFTWNLGHCVPDYQGHESQVTVELAEQKDGTLVTITHEGLPTSDLREKHQDGWNLSLDNLAQRI